MDGTRGGALGTRRRRHGRDREWEGCSFLPSRHPPIPYPLRCPERHTPPPLPARSGPAEPRPKLIWFTSVYTLILMILKCMFYTRNLKIKQKKHVKFDWEGGALPVRSSSGCLSTDGIIHQFPTYAEITSYPSYGIVLDCHCFVALTDKGYVIRPHCSCYCPKKTDLQNLV